MDTKPTPRPRPKAQKPRMRENRTPKTRKKYVYRAITDSGVVWTVHADSELEVVEYVRERTKKLPISVTKIPKIFKKTERLMDSPFKGLDIAIKEKKNV